MGFPFAMEGRVQENRRDGNSAAKGSMNHHDGEVTDVVIVLDDLNDEQTQEVVTHLKSAGLAVSTVNNDTSTVEGSIDSQKVHDLKKVAKVRYVRSVMSYTVDYPPGDPRDQDGPEEECDEQED
jgi:hypothetical protein